MQHMQNDGFLHRIMSSNDLNFINDPLYGCTNKLTCNFVFDLILN